MEVNVLILIVMTFMSEVNVNIKTGVGKSGKCTAIVLLNDKCNATTD